MSKYIYSSIYLVLFSLLFVGCRREEDVLSATFEDAFQYKDYKIYSDSSAFVCGEREGVIEVEENTDKALCIAKIKARAAYELQLIAPFAVFRMQRGRAAYRYVEW